MRNLEDKALGTQALAMLAKENMASSTSPLLTKETKNYTKESQKNTTQTRQKLTKATVYTTWRGNKMKYTDIINRL